MLEDYLKYLEKAKQLEKEISDKYEILKKDLSISIRDKLKIILEGDDFLIVKHVDSISKMIKKYAKIDKEHNNGLVKIKERLELNLAKNISFYTFITSKL